MADDTILLPGGGGDRLRTEEIGIKKYPVSKIVLGAAGVDDGDVSAANPMPVTGTMVVNVGLTDAELRASPVPVTGPLTDTQLRALAVPVSGTFFQATQPVSGPLTDAQLRATPVAVSGTVTATVTGGATEAKQDTQITSLQLLDNVIAQDTSSFNYGSDWVSIIAGVVWDGAETSGPGLTRALSLKTSMELRVSDADAFSKYASIETNTASGAVVDNGLALTAQRVTIASDSTGQVAIAGSVAVTGTFFQATQPVSLASVPSHDVTNAGTFLVQAAQSDTWTIQIGNTPNSTPILTSERPATSGGLSVSSFLSTAAVEDTVVKASPGQIYSLSFFNKGAAAVYLRLYNMTTTPGTGDTPIWRAIIPGNTAGAGLVKHFPNGLAFSTGIGFRCTGAIADNDATALAANEVTGNIEYN